MSSEIVASAPQGSLQPLTSSLQRQRSANGLWSLWRVSNLEAASQSSNQSCAFLQRECLRTQTASCASRHPKDCSLSRYSFAPLPQLLTYSSPVQWLHHTPWSSRDHHRPLHPSLNSWTLTSWSCSYSSFHLLHLWLLRLAKALWYDKCWTPTYRVHWVLECNLFQRSYLWRCKDPCRTCFVVSPFS